MIREIWKPSKAQTSVFGGGKRVRTDTRFPFDAFGFDTRMKPKRGQQNHAFYSSYCLVNVLMKQVV